MRAGGISASHQRDDAPEVIPSSKRETDPVPLDTIEPSS